MRLLKLPTKLFLWTLICASQLQTAFASTAPIHPDDEKILSQRMEKTLHLSTGSSLAFSSPPVEISMDRYLAMINRSLTPIDETLSPEIAKIGRKRAIPRAYSQGDMQLLPLKKKEQRSRGISDLGRKNPALSVSLTPTKSQSSKNLDLMISHSNRSSEYQSSPETILPFKSKEDQVQASLEILRSCEDRDIESISYAVAQIKAVKGHQYKGIHRVTILGAASRLGKNNFKHAAGTILFNAEYMADNVQLRMIGEHYELLGFTKDADRINEMLSRHPNPAQKAKKLKRILNLIKNATCTKDEEKEAFFLDLIKNQGFHLPSATILGVSLSLSSNILALFEDAKTLDTDEILPVLTTMLKDHPSWIQEQALNRIEIKKKFEKARKCVAQSELGNARMICEQINKNPQATASERRQAVNILGSCQDAI